MDYDFDQCNSVSDGCDGAAFSRTNSKGSRILGFVLGRRSMKEHTLSKEENDSNGGRLAQLERAEIAADLLETRWSTNYTSRSRESRNDNGDVTGGRLETSVVLHEQHFVNKSENSEVDHELPSMKDEETIAADDFNGVDKDADENCVSEECSRTQLDDANEPEVGLITGQGSLKFVPESYAEGASNQEDATIDVGPCSSVAVPFCQNVDGNLTKEVDETNEIKLPLEPNGEFQVSEPVVEEQLIFGDLDDSKPNVSKIEHEVKQGGIGSASVMYGRDLLKVRTYKERSKGDIEGLKGNLRRCQSNLEIPKSREIPNAEIGRQAKSLPKICRFNDPIPDNQDESQFYSPVGRFRSNWDLLREDASRFKKAIIQKELRPRADDLSKDLKDGSIASSSRSLFDILVIDF